MSVYRDEGIVLRTLKLGEADSIVTLLTKRHGKVRAVAKGVRRTKSRFGARLEPFMRVDVLLARGRSLDVISQAESLAAYALGIIADYDAYAAAGVMVETADRIVAAEHQPAVQQYQLLRAALAALASHAHRPSLISYSYMLRALAIEGWAPRLGACVVCNATSDLRFVSAASGGSMCEIDHTPDARKVDAACLEQLQALLTGDWPLLDRSMLSANAAQVVEQWGQFYLERPLRSLRLLDS